MKSVIALFRRTGTLRPVVMTVGNSMDFIHSVLGTGSPDKRMVGDNIMQLTGPNGTLHMAMSDGEFSDLSVSDRKALRSRKRVYLSGAITGNDDAQFEFASAELILSEKYDVFNPMSLEGKYQSYEEYMLHDIRELLSCQHICFVNDIATSRGSQVEKMVAAACGIQEVSLDDCV